MFSSMSSLCQRHRCRSFAVCAENPTGGKGQGGRATEGFGKQSAEGLGVGWKISPCLTVKAGETAVLADIKGQGAIRHIWITDSADSGRDMLLRIFWDGRDTPSVECPLGDFFCNPHYGEHRQISSLAICVNSRRAMNSYFEMPYRKGFRVTVENTTDKEVLVFYQIDCEEKEV
ncbi:MAG: DUF2961 domain-containing protein, partial [Clostridia bacterium]|nr:DUF2961 domain-containing protein [Clostridia bacterium]